MQSASQAAPRATVFVIGGSSSDRATIAYSSSTDALRFEPLGSLEELGPSELAAASALLIASDPDLIEEVDTQLAIACQWVPIIAFSNHPTVREVVRALEAGAVDFLAIPSTPPTIIEKIETACRKGRLLQPQWQRALCAETRLQKLSRREREVITAVAYGLPNKRIAKLLSISDRTVEIYRAKALAKLGVNHSAEAIRLVLESESDIAMRIHARQTRSRKPELSSLESLFGNSSYMSEEQS